MNKYTNIEEFEPVELIIAYDINDVPTTYQDILKTWFDTDEDIRDVWDYGDQIRMLHWEWKCGNDYYLIMDITGFPNNEEQGIIAYNGQIIFENNNQKLHPMIKKKKDTLEGLLLSRQKAFEYVRKLTKDNNPHCINVRTLYEELKTDLEEESVSEDEFKEILTQPYIHYSSDDASDISSDNDQFYDSESFESY